MNQFRAAETGNLQWFIDQKATGRLPDLMQPDFRNVYPHELAAYHGHLDVFQWIVEESGQDVDVTAHSNLSVRCASENGHLDVIRYLVEESKQRRQARLDLRIAQLTDPEELRATYKKIRDTIQAVDVTTEDNYAVRWAARNGHLDVVKYLVEDAGQDVDVSAVNSYAIRFAAENGHLNIIKFLIKKSDQPVDVLLDYNHAIQLAAANGHLDVVRYLVEDSGQAGDVTANDNFSVRRAANNGHLDVVKYLIRHGAGTTTELCQQCNDPEVDRLHVARMSLTQHPYDAAFICRCLNNDTVVNMIIVLGVVPSRQHLETILAASTTAAPCRSTRL